MKKVPGVPGLYVELGVFEKTPDGVRCVRGVQRRYLVECPPEVEASSWPALDRFDVTWNGKNCPLGDNDMFLLMKMLIEAEGKPVSYGDIGETIYNDPYTLSTTIRGLKRRLVNKLHEHGMNGLADAIRPGRRKYFLEIS